MLVSAGGWPGRWDYEPGGPGLVEGGRDISRGEGWVNIWMGLVRLFMHA